MCKFTFIEAKTKNSDVPIAAKHRVGQGTSDVAILKVLKIGRLLRMVRIAPTLKIHTETVLSPEPSKESPRSSQKAPKEGPNKIASSRWCFQRRH